MLSHLELSASDRVKANDIMVLQYLNIDTVYDRRKNWLSKGFAFLFEVHRSGEPPKLNAIHLEQINIWVQEEALTAPAIVSQLKEECYVEVRAGTARNTL